MKRVLAAVLILMMVPLFMGVFCPCASAAEPVDGPSLTKAPCHGCCTEISASPDLVADLIRNSIELPSFYKASPVLKAPNPGSLQEIADNRRAHAPAGGEPFAFLQTPLYLALQVIRI